MHLPLEQFLGARVRFAGAIFDLGETALDALVFETFFLSIQRYEIIGEGRICGDCRFAAKLNRFLGSITKCVTVRKKLAENELCNDSNICNAISHLINRHCIEITKTYMT